MSHLLIDRTHKSIIAYKTHYIFPGNLTADGNIKIKLSRPLVVQGSIYSSGDIISSNGIVADGSICACGNISSKACLHSGIFISAGANITARGITSKGCLSSGRAIKVSADIWANKHIECGEQMEARGHIYSGSGIRAGRHISCASMYAVRPVYVGVHVAEMLEDSDRRLLCDDFKGTLAYGTLCPHGSTGG